MKRKWVKFLLLPIFLVCSAAWALKPLTLASDHRIEEVAFSPYSVVPIYGTTFTTTQITFGKNEVIENVQNGDLGAWTASISPKMPNMMFIKPVVYSSNTNMTVVTNKHTYYFHLMSNSPGGMGKKHTTYAIHFIYPEDKIKKIESAIARREEDKATEMSAFESPQKFNWDYSFHGDTSILPLHVFDNGKFTYFQLQPNQPIPAIFVVTSKSGKEAVVNYRREGQYVVVLRVAPQFTLRLGQNHVVSIFNNKQIAAVLKSWF